jgi:hypothetical protein
MDLNALRIGHDASIRTFGRLIKCFGLLLVRLS